MSYSFWTLSTQTLDNNIVNKTYDRSRCPVASRIRVNNLLEKKARRDCVLNLPAGQTAMAWARSSAGQSICLLSRGSQVRVLPGLFEIIRLEAYTLDFLQLFGFKCG